MATRRRSGASPRPGATRSGRWLLLAQVGQFALAGLIALAIVGLATAIASRRIGEREAIVRRPHDHAHHGEGARRAGDHRRAARRRPAGAWPTSTGSCSVTCSTAASSASSSGPPTAASSTRTSRRLIGQRLRPRRRRARGDRLRADRGRRQRPRRSPRTATSGRSAEAARGVPPGPHAVGRAAPLRGVLRVRLGERATARGCGAASPRSRSAPS